MVVSSAYIITWHPGAHRGISLIYNINNIVPKTDPCGTPITDAAKDE